MEYELCIREAEAQDAAALVAFLDLVGQETDFTSLDENGILMTESEIAGVLNITAEQRIQIRHIGDIFLVIQRKFWNHGLGSILLEEGIEWAKTSGVLRRLQLSVQKRNEAAIHLYSKFGFVTEGLQERGAYLEEGIFLDVYLMGRLIDK
jgi:acetyltransferase, GNAT family